MKLVAIIPARGGSKRLPGKNIKLLLGIPLIGYSIRDAFESKRFDKVIVSTEDNEIVKVSERFNAEVTLRPMSLALDDSTTMDVIFHVMDQLKNDFDKSTIVVLLQPTSPLRTTEDINKSLDLFLNNKCDSVISVCKVLKNPFWCLKSINGYLEPFLEEKYFNMSIEDFKSIYNINGAVYVAKLKTLLKYQSYLCKYTIPYIMPKERSIDIDIDTDFIQADYLLKKRLEIT